MTVPARLVGAWRRCGLLIDGVRQVDFCDVLWLQAPSWFADIRIPMSPSIVPPTAPARRMARSIAMAGHAEWVAPVMTWRHTFGDTSSSSCDSGNLEWRDNVMFEHGSIVLDHDRFGFTEEWLRMSSADDVPAVDTRPEYMRIAIGRWAIELSTGDDRSGLTAIRRDLIDGSWREIGRIST